MQKHVTAVAALQIGFGIFGIALGILIIFLIGWASTFVEEPEVAVILPTLAVVIGGSLVTLSALSVIGGVGLLKYRNWARILILIISAFDLLNIPIGTAVAIYTFWVLVQDETARLFGVQSTAPIPPQGT